MRPQVAPSSIFAAPAFAHLLQWSLPSRFQRFSRSIISNLYLFILSNTSSTVYHTSGAQTVLQTPDLSNTISVTWKILTSRVSRKYFPPHLLVFVVTYRKSQHLVASRVSL
ncbi:hypothetical protein F5880DRAFT_935357 [Lentinula raphanica]|nr:hypothetical protein F5880DRAFT_935357 [Lentinula raphanica]